MITVRGSERPRRRDGNVKPLCTPSSEDQHHLLGLRRKGAEKVEDYYITINKNTIGDGGRAITVETVETVDTAKCRSGVGDTP